LHGKYVTRASLDHYLELLARKPGALARSLPLAQERDRSSWPATFDGLWALLRGRWGRVRSRPADGREAERGPATVELAVRGVLAGGAIDGRAVGMLARRTSPATRAARLDGLEPRLAAHNRPEPDLAGYDQLIGGARSPRPKRQERGAGGADRRARRRLEAPDRSTRFRQLAEEATREQQTPVAHPAALVEVEMTERAERREKRRLIDARFP
jgi:hypothetical protein